MSDFDHTHELFPQDNELLLKIVGAVEKNQSQIVTIFEGRNENGPDLLDYQISLANSEPLFVTGMPGKPIDTLQAYGYISLDTGSIPD